MIMRKGGSTRRQGQQCPCFEHGMAYGGQTAFHTVSS